MIDTRVIENILFNEDIHKEKLEKIGFSFEVKEIIPPSPHPFGDKFPMLDERIIYNATIPSGAIIRERGSNPKYFKDVILNGEIIASIYHKIGQYTDLEKISCKNE